MKHGFSLTELEMMIPFEREVFIALTAHYVEEQERINKEQ